jgi:hypothetical protein
LSRYTLPVVPASPSYLSLALITAGPPEALNRLHPECPRVHDIGSTYQFAASAGPADAPGGCQFCTSGLPVAASKTCTVAGAVQESLATYVVSPVQSVSWQPGCSVNVNSQRRLPVHGL